MRIIGHVVLRATVALVFVAGCEDKRPSAYGTAARHKPFVAFRKGAVIVHLPDCRIAKAMGHNIVGFDTLEAAYRYGLQPCRFCKPGPLPPPPACRTLITVTVLKSEGADKTVYRLTNMTGKTINTMRGRVGGYNHLSQPVAARDPVIVTKDNRMVPGGTLDYIESAEPVAWPDLRDVAPELALFFHVNDITYADDASEKGRE